MSAFGDRRRLARAGGALVLANVRFWPTVAPLLGVQLERWEKRARAIEDSELRSLALQKLCEERFNAEVAATLATLAPREHRGRVVEALVAYEVMYDYLDALTERPSADPIGSGRALYRAFIDAIALGQEPAGRYYPCSTDDGGYLTALVGAVRGALAHLPARNAIADTAERAAARCAEAQIRAHAAAYLGAEQLERWATGQREGTPLGWREFLAGAASSVLAVHALIAAAADAGTTPAEAREIDGLYLSIGTLSTLLDGLVDHDRDMGTSDYGYLRYYESHELLTSDLARAAHRAAQQAAPLRSGAHHTMTMAGVAAYYLSAPTAETPFARPAARRLRAELEPLITPTLAVMRVWRAAKCTRIRILGAGI